jgi:hypothetical protein
MTRSVSPILISVFFCLMLCGVKQDAVAQNQQQLQRLSFGAKFGLGANWIRLRETLKNDNQVTTRYSPSFGLFFQANGSRKFQVEVDVLYSYRGFRGNGRISDDLVPNGVYREFIYDSRTIDIPILFKFLGGNSPTWRRVFFFGPYYSGPLKTDYVVNASIIPATNDLKRDDWGLIVGGGLVFKFFQRYLSIDLRYSHGLRSLGDGIDNELLPSYGLLYSQKPRVVVPENFITFRNSQISLMLGLSLEKAQYYK